MGQCQEILLFELMKNPPWWCASRPPPTHSETLNRPPKHKMYVLRIFWRPVSRRRGRLEHNGCAKIQHSSPF
jgi:hypothetical protein